MKITLIIPTLNEESTIGKVVKDYKKNNKIDNIIVYDGNSSDRTREYAKKAGAFVLIQQSKGKGNAIREIFKKIDSDVYILVDGDDTYPPGSINALLKPIISKKMDMVVGNRINTKSERGSLNWLHKFGNKIISGIIRICFRNEIYDVLSGYRAISRNLVKGISLDSKGFEIETELTIKSLIGKYRIMEIPIKYRKRKIGSKSKISSFGDGYLILFTIFSMLRDFRPLFFFSVLSLIFGLFGVYFGIMVIDEWIRTGIITKIPTAILSALFVFMSVQFFTIGVILDSINKFRRK